MSERSFELDRENQRSATFSSSFKLVFKTWILKMMFCCVLMISQSVLPNILCERAWHKCLNCLWQVSRHFCFPMCSAYHCVFVWLSSLERIFAEENLINDFSLIYFLISLVASGLANPLLYNAACDLSKLVWKSCWLPWPGSGILWSYIFSFDRVLTTWVTKRKL